MKKLIICLMFLSVGLLSGCKHTAPYMPTSSDVPYGFVKGDTLHRTHYYDTESGTYKVLPADKQTTIQFDFDGIAGSYHLWKVKNEAQLKELIDDIEE